MEALNNISNHPTVEKHGPKIALIGSILLLLIFIVTCGFSIRAQAKIKAENYEPQPVQAINKNNRPRYRINDVVSANLFGNPAPVKVVKNAPKTTLDLTLQGILSATDSTVARAIISSQKKKKAELYSVGEEIKGAGASIKEIREQEVILNRNGAIESLPLQKLESKGDTSVYVPLNRTATNSKQKVLDKSASSSATAIPTPNPNSQARANTQKRKINRP